MTSFLRDAPPPKKNPGSAPDPVDNSEAFLKRLRAKIFVYYTNSIIILIIIISSSSSSSSSSSTIVVIIVIGLSGVKFRE